MQVSKKVNLYVIYLSLSYHANLGRILNPSFSCQDLFSMLCHILVDYTGFLSAFLFLQKNKKKMCNIKQGFIRIFPF